MTNNTIAAIATPAGVGGIAVLRVSGPSALEVVSRFCTGMIQPRKAHYTLFRIGDRLIDETVVTYYPAPHSYTGEDVVEIACHGSTYVQQTLLQALIDAGAQIAAPGEFTQRAFVNGCLDLSQAEAVADLIDSTNAASHQLAISQLRGGYAQQLRQLRDQFVELTSLLELELDFSDEEVEFADRQQLRQLLSTISSTCSQLIESFRLGNAIKNGIPVAIVGQPNVGKSTLLNALVGDDRAIVSDIPGTTRDTIEDQVVIDGVQYRFVDTAGIRHSEDLVESEGIRRSYAAAKKAQVVLYMVDASRDARSVEEEVNEFRKQVDLSDKQFILLRNKSDIEVQSPESKVESSELCVRISAKTGEGINQLRQLLSQNSQLSTLNSQFSTPLVTNVRHYEALQRVLEACEHVREGFDQQLPADLVVIDLRDALYHLGTITGQVTSDEVLGSIFGRFCIGK